MCSFASQNSYGQETKSRQKCTFSTYLARAKGLRPAGSDPGSVCQKIIFLKVSVSLRGFGPSVALGKLSVRGR